MIKTARALDEESKPFMKDFLEGFRVKINSNAELRDFIANNKIQFVFAKGIRPEFGYGRINIDITCWMTNDRLKSDKVRLSTTLHELMHGIAAKHKKYDTYVENVFKATRDDFMKVPYFQQIIESAEHGGKNLDNLLQEHWKQFIKISLENQNQFMETTAANITDFTHAIISGYMDAKQIEMLDMKKQFELVVSSLDSNIDPRGAWHDWDYYVYDHKNSKNKKAMEKSVKQYREFAADEFQANMGSLYFTDRKVFDAYKKILPNSLQMIENFIKEGKIDIVENN